MGIARCHGESRTCGRRPLCEQVDGLARCDVLPAVRLGGRPQRWHGVDLLTRNTQRLTTRGQQPHPRGRRQQGLAERRACIHEVLAVVEQDRHGAPREGGGDRLGESLSRCGADAQGVGHCLADQGRGRQRHQVDQPGLVRTAVDQVPGDL
jgi:hypothetical protein